MEYRQQGNLPTQQPHSDTELPVSGRCRLGVCGSAAHRIRETCKLRVWVGFPSEAIVEEILTRMGRSDLLRLEARPVSPSEPVSLVADMARLKGLGCRPHYGLTDKLRQTIDWWRSAEERSCMP